MIQATSQVRVTKLYKVCLRYSDHDSKYFLIQRNNGIPSMVQVFSLQFEIPFD